VCRYLREYKALGTGGGLYHFRDQILAGKPDYLIVLHSDVYADLRLQEALDAHARNTHARSTVLGKRVARDQTRGLGCLVSNAQGEVLHYAEKPETFVSDVINCGVYFFRPSVIELLSEAYALNQTCVPIHRPTPSLTHIRTHSITHSPTHTHAHISRPITRMCAGGIVCVCVSVCVSVCLCVCRRRADDGVGVGVGVGLRGKTGAMLIQSTTGTLRRLSAWRRTCWAAWPGRARSMCT
jgi:hypothetical protein